MKKYTMKQRSLPLDDSWDVIVVGGGPAGCTAAAASAREGAKTLLIEATGALGGMGTSGLVPAWCPFTDQVRIIYGGLAEKVLKETTAGMPHVPPERFDWTPIDPERLKRVYDELVTGSGASVWFGTTLVEVACSQPGTPDALIVAGKAGLEALRASVYVDCTGDGDLAVWSGADFEKGDESGDLQPATHCFILSNVNMAAYRSGGQLTREKMVPILASGKYPQIPDRHSCNCVIGPGTVGFNAGHLWNVDATKPETVTKALIEGRKLAKAFRDALAEFYGETYGDAFLVATGSLMGIRETRRIIGDYYLTIDDFANVRSFPDEICRNCYYIDVHHKQSEIGTARDGDGDALYLKKGQSHGIPYRCLTPKGLRNVLVAGRCISTDRAVQGSVRIMPVCLCTGEAAGLAAAMAAAAAGDVHAVDTDDLRKRLKTYGAYLPD